MKQTAKCLWCGKEIKGKSIQALVDRGQPAKEFHPECFPKMRDAMDPPRNTYDEGTLEAIRKTMVR